MIFIQNNVPSIKNSKQIVVIKRESGRIERRLISSKTVKKYLFSLGIESYSTRKKEIKLNNEFNGINPFRSLMDLFFEKEKLPSVYPVTFYFFFVRSSRRKFDYNNVMQILADLLVAHDFIPDDDADHFIGIPCGYIVEPEAPGVYISFNPISKEAAMKENKHMRENYYTDEFFENLRMRWENE